jgi:hypothetical protein
MLPLSIPGKMEGAMIYSRVTAVLLLLASGAAMAGPFDGLQQIASTRTGSIWYVDRSTLKTDGHMTSAWLTMDHSRDRTERARQSRALIEIECGAHRFHWVQYFSYRRNGSPMPERVRPNVIMDIVAGSPIETVANGLCQRGA